MIARRALLAILLCQVAALGFEAWRLSLTADEPSHLAAEYMYWTGRDFLYPSDTPPLTRMIGGWVPVLLHAQFRIAPGPLKDQNAYLLGMDMFGSLPGKEARWFLFWCRLPFLVFPLSITFLVWHWGRQLFGDEIAILTAACAALEPSILGHGALIASDVPAACMALAFCYACWWHWKMAGRRSLLMLLLASVAAALAKFSLLALLPFALLVILWRGPRLLGLVLLPLSLYAAILLSYQLQIRMFPMAELDAMLRAGLPDLLRRRVLAILHWAPWPEQFLRGLGFIGAADRGEGFSAYMLGRRITGSAPWYFPLCLAIKSPIALQILAVAGAAIGAARLWARRSTAAELFVWAPAAWLFALAVRSHIHLGFRHVLPVVPLLILAGGFGMQRWGILRAAPVWLLGASLFIFPHGISYFNEWIGGPANGPKYLADSNLDWGQDMADLARYAREHAGVKIRMALFGPEPMAHYLPDGSFEEIPIPFDMNQPAPDRFVPEPGVYAISANYVAGFVLPPARSDYFAWFREHRPMARAGWSMWIYRVEPKSAHGSDIPLVRYLR